MSSPEAEQLFDPTTSDLLVTLLGAYLEPRTARIRASGLLEVLQLFGVGPSAARIMLARVVQRGIAERHRRGRNVDYTLTARGIHLLEGADERFESLRGPDEPSHSWTIIWHELDDSRKAARSALVRQLRFHGFGQLQSGLWVSPKDHVSEVEELAASLDIRDSVVPFRAEPPHDLVPRELLDRLWRLNDVAGRYRLFVDGYGPVISTAYTDDRDLFIAYTRLIHVYRSFAYIDPELPERFIDYRQDREAAAAIAETADARFRPRAKSYFQQRAQSVDTV